jgi:two-component system response regulator CpxR
MAKVLVIDDDPMVAATVRGILRQSHHDAVCVGRGRLALDLLQESRFDLAICDLIMPDMEGLETIAHLKRMRPELAVIAMSGGGRTKNFDFLKMASKVGAADTLPKPFSGEEMMTVVNRHLREPAAQG